MKLYFAPLEGITTCTYRNIHAEVFGRCDGYFAPFITPSDNERISLKTLRDVVPERNRCGALTVQVLTNRADSFLKFAQKVKALGYEEININLGCPMARVVQKNRGAGFLREPEALDRFLEEIFLKSDVKISVKTRIGFHSGNEMEALMKVYNRYPLSRLIVHPRACADLYRGKPDYDTFKEVYSTSLNPLCYNGDVNSVEDFARITESFPNLDSVMLGRGALQNPALFREIAGGEKLSTKELLTFSVVLAEAYSTLLESEAFTLHKLKEIWAYQMQNFPDAKKVSKAIKKANKLTDFTSALCALPPLT